MAARGWAETGLDPSEVADAIGFGLDADEVLEWRPFRPIEIHSARRSGLPLAEARAWAAAGVAVRDAVWARRVGLTPEQVGAWRSEEFAAADACEAAEVGVSMRTAIAWREAGFIVPDAMQLIRDGWTLDKAVTARYADLRRPPRGQTSTASS